MEATSRIYFSGPAGGVARCVFHNAAVRVRTVLPPDTLLAALKRLEVRLGRRPGRRLGDRRLDLDLLLYGPRIVIGRDLVVPHPRLPERPFALAPLLDAWPDASDPWTGRPLAAFPCAQLPVVGVLPKPGRPA